MRLKKTFTTIFACVLALTSLAACSKKDANSSITNSDPTAWERDINEHWLLSDDGEKIEASDHDMVDNVCSICESEIWIFEDGSADIYNYAEYGDFLRLTSYDTDGNITMDTRYEYKYDENGNIVQTKQYEFDILVQEIEYVVTLEGESIMAMQTFYSDDGTVYVNECDGNGNIIIEYYYDVNGEQIVIAEYAYTYTTDVDFFLSTKIEYFDDGTKFIIDYNEYGDTIHWYAFDPYGSLTSDKYYEYEYDSEGNMVSSKEYDGSWLTNEYEYALDSDGYSYCIKETIYNEDGSVTYIEYDENLDITSNTTHDASGNVIG